MTHRQPEQYDGPRAVAESCVHRLFEYIVWSEHVVEPCTVQLGPNANDADHQSPDVDDGLWSDIMKTYQSQAMKKKLYAINRPLKCL